MKSSQPKYHRVGLRIPMFTLVREIFTFTPIKFPNLFTDKFITFYQILTFTPINFPGMLRLHNNQWTSYKCITNEKTTIKKDEENNIYRKRERSLKPKHETNLWNYFDCTTEDILTTFCIETYFLSWYTMNYVPCVSLDMATLTTLPV